MASKILNSLVVVFALFFFSCGEDIAESGGYGTVTGKVVLTETFEPIKNVKISSSPNTSSVFTDENGNFTITNIPVGNYSFEARKEGYVAKFEGVSVAVNSETNVVFELKVEETENKPPSAPALSAPLNDAQNVNLTIDLNWDSIDEDQDSLTYKVIVKNDKNADVQTYENIKQKTFQLTGLKYSTKYFWQVAVSDGVNPEINSLVSNFSTLAFPNARFLFTRVVDGNNVIFTANEAGEELQITSSANNCYRPKRNTQINRIAFIKTDGAHEHIYTMKPDGSDILRITNSVPIAGFNMNYVSFSWSGNGSQIMYPNFDKLYKINADGSGLTLFYQAPAGRFVSECDWSVDGTRVAVKTNTINGYTAEIIILDANGNLLETIVSGFNGAIGSLHFSVNNQKLLYTRDISAFESPDYRQLDTNMFIYDFTTSTSEQLDVSKPAGTNDLDARFSPNEAEVIIMNTSNDGVSVKNIQRISLSETNGNTNSRTTIFTNGFMPDWR